MFAGIEAVLLSPLVEVWFMPLAEMDEPLER
jgi:hypothetical protein